MACRISELVLDAADPERLAAFWSGVLGYVELGREDDGSIEIGPPDTGFGGPQPTLVLSPGTDPRPGKLPLHIDVNATDRDQDAELRRLLALGAGPPTWARPARRTGTSWPTRRQRVLPLARPDPAAVTTGVEPQRPESCGSCRRVGSPAPREPVPEGGAR